MAAASGSVTMTNRSSRGKLVSLKPAFRIAFSVEFFALYDQLYSSLDQCDGSAIRVPTTGTVMMMSTGAVFLISSMYSVDLTKQLYTLVR
jgi:hypothetical protein